MKDIIGNVFDYTILKLYFYQMGQVINFIHWEYEARVKFRVSILFY